MLILPEKNTTKWCGVANRRRVLDIGHISSIFIEPFDKISCQNCYGQKSTISIERIACFSANINAEYNTLSAFKTYGPSDSWVLGPVSSIQQQFDAFLWNSRLFWILPSDTTASELTDFSLQSFHRTFHISLSLLDSFELLRMFLIHVECSQSFRSCQDASIQF